MSENCNECAIKKYCDMLDDITDNQLILDIQHNILLAIYEQGRTDAIEEFKQNVIEYVESNGTIPNHFNVEKIAERLKEQNDGHN